MKTRLPYLLILVAFLGLILNGCKTTGCTDPTAIDYDPDATESGDCVYPNLMLHFHPLVGGEDLNFDNTFTIGGVAVKFSVVQFYVSAAAVSGNGVADENEDTYLLVKAGTMNYPVGQITAGSKESVRFSVGLDSTTNHADPTLYESDNPLALQSPSMHWSWDKGYQFIKIEGMVDTDNDGTPDAAMEFHIGKDSNLRTISLDISQSADMEMFMVNIDYDLAKLFDGIDLSTEYITHTGDFPALATKVIENVPGTFSIQ
ncbi:MAG: MbnP family protein [Bacteroidota bacterium]